MKREPYSKRPQVPGQRWAKALDPDAYDKQYAAVVRYLRKDVCKISLMEAERRSDLCHQFWSKVEKAETHPSSHNEVKMANALRVRPHVIHRLAERWTRLGRKLRVMLVVLLGCLEPVEELGMGV
jgi:hypothetical protein